MLNVVSSHLARVMRSLAGVVNRRRRISRLNISSRRQHGISHFRHHASASKIEKHELSSSVRYRLIEGDNTSSSISSACILLHGAARMSRIYIQKLIKIKRHRPCALCNGQRGEIKVRRFALVSVLIGASSVSRRYVGNEEIN